MKYVKLGEVVVSSLKLLLLLLKLLLLLLSLLLLLLQVISDTGKSKLYGGHGREFYLLVLNLSLVRFAHS